MRFEIDAYGTRELRSTLERLREAGDDPRPAFEEVADFFEATADSAFRTSGAAIGVRWRPLAQMTVKYRRPGPMGVQTGLLRRSMATKGARHHRRLITRDAVTVKSTAPHAHLFSGGRGGQPARPLVNIRPDDRKAVAGILQRYLTGAR